MANVNDLLGIQVGTHLITIDKGGKKDQDEFLVDGSGKLVYTFAPQGFHPIVLADAWPGASKNWVQLWQPIVIPGRLDKADEARTLAGRTDAGYFGEFEASREHGRRYELRWGADHTTVDGAKHAFWGLYTYAFDRPLAEYAVVQHGVPPGYVHGVWHPAWLAEGVPEVDDTGLLRGGDPPGITQTGGP